MSRIISLLFCIALYFPTLAQHEERCGFDSRMDKVIQNDPDFLKTIEQQELIIQSLQKGNSRSLDDEVTTIPVVVHIMHTGQDIGAAVNITDAQIESAIVQLNKAFAGIDGYSTPGSGIQFALASRSPDCQPTNGIVRVNATGVCVGDDCYEIKGITSANEHAVKSLSRWPAHSYLNIWVVREIDDNGAKSGVQGFARFPGGDPALDGIVILYNAFGYKESVSGPFNLKSNTKLGTILIHEVGHSLGLYHSFEGDDYNRDGIGDRCPSLTGCGRFNGDCVDDTPPHRRSLGTCNVSGTNVCDGGYSNELFVHNFMDYSSEDCQYEFTKGQVDRMKATLLSSREGWVHSMGNMPLSAEKPVSTQCTPLTQYPDNNFNLGILEFRLGDFTSASGNTQEDGGYVDNWCSVIAAEPGKSYDLMVNTGSQNAQNVKVFVDYNGDGDFSDSGETIFTSEKSKSHQGKIIIPLSAKKGVPLRVRAIAAYSGFSIADGCFQPYYGQVEDYSMIIGAPLLADTPDNSIGETGENGLAWSLQPDDHDYSVYPNPTSDLVYLARQGESEVKELELLDLQGRSIANYNTGDGNLDVMEISLSDLSSGIYYLRITDDEKVIVRKLHRL